MPFDKWTYTIRLLFTVWILDCTSIQIPIALTYLSLHFRPGAPQANSSSSSSVISLKELEESAALKRRQITPLSTITTSTTASMRSAATSPAKPSMLSKSSPQLRRSAGLEFICCPYEASNLAIAQIEVAFRICYALFTLLHPLHLTLNRFTKQGWLNW